MLYATISAEGFIVGVGSAYHSAAVEVPTEFHESNLREWRLVNGQWTVDLSDLIQEKQAQIKHWCTDQMAATQWRVERAEERVALGLSGVETPADVYAEREAIRRASNRAESAVAVLTSQQAIEMYEWSVEQQDYP